MSETDWLRVTLERMQSDIDEIKQDVKVWHEFKFKLAGGVFVLSSLITVLLNLVGLYLRAGR